MASTTVAVNKIRTLQDTAAAYLQWLWSIYKSKSAPVCSVGKDVLIVTRAFPPQITGGVFRPFSLAKYASRAGISVSVVCAEYDKEHHHPAGRELLDALPEHVKVIRINSDLLPSYEAFPRVDGGFCHALEVFKRVLKERGSVGPKIIFATGPPFNSFVAGYFLARYFGSKLVLDYRDEWTECPFHFVRVGKFDRWWEERCLKFADRVIFTTDSQRKHNISRFPDYDQTKCIVIPNGWDTEDAAVDESSIPQCCCHSGRFEIALLGYLGGHNSPDIFLETLASILSRRIDLREKVLIKFVGHKDEEQRLLIERFPYPGVVLNVPPVTKNSANVIMRNSDALLLDNNSNFSRYIPGKLYEYLASKTPIIVCGAGGEIANIVTTLDAGVVITDIELHLEYILDQMLPCKGYKNDSAALDKWLHAHTRENLAKTMCTMFDKL